MMAEVSHSPSLPQQIQSKGQGSHTQTLYAFGTTTKQIITLL